MRPDHNDPVGELDRLLRDVSLRRLLLHTMLSLVCGSIAGAVYTLAAVSLGAPAVPGAYGGVLAAIVMLWSTRKQRTRSAAAAMIDRASPSSKNIVITAEELARVPVQGRSPIADVVFARAAAAVREMHPGDVVPASGIAAAAVVAFIIALLPVIWVIPGTRTPGPLIAGAPASPGDGVLGVRVHLEPPGYAGKPPVQLENPDRIEVLEGTRVRVELSSGAAVRMRLVERPVENPFRAVGSGYLAIRPAGDHGDLRLITMTVVPDEPPSVRIEAPGHDLLLPTAARSIPIRLQAADDLALQSLELRYTKVSGGGEQFEFQEGRLAVALTRATAREWSGSAALDPRALRLEPGDAVAYRAVAVDSRPDASGVAASDTFVIEIAGPGQVPLDAMAMPPEMDRYALSQQMVVLKLERLRARERSLAREDVVEQTAAIAAEQRSVRANFIFLLGGHVEDEEVEAEQSHEIQEGRLENEARRDINAAIGEMSRVGGRLAGVDTSGALQHARRAVEALQRAFGRRRYLLRALAASMPLDPTRRLSGDVRSAGEWRRDAHPTTARDGAEARALLSRLIAARTRAPKPVEWQALAEAALRIDPAAAAWRDVSRGLSGIAARTARGEGPDRLLREVTERVAHEAQRGTLSGALSPSESPLKRAWAEAQRQ